MARKLRTFKTSVGFYDLAIAAPSMKAALEAWGAGSNLFHQGFAAESDDPEVVAATMAQPGVVLKRPAGSTGRFTEHAGLPTDLADDRGREKSRRRLPKKKPDVKVNDKTARKAAADFEREQKKRDAKRRKEEAARDKQRARREEMTGRAQAALDRAGQDHEKRIGSLEAERNAIQKRVEAEDARWESEKERLTKALRRARG
jgi:colicin import membrane protein